QVGCGDTADGNSAAQQASRGHYRPVDAEFDFSAELARDFRLRRLPRFSEALFGRRVETRVQGAFAGGILPSLQPDGRPLHDAATRGGIRGVLPVLRRGPGKGPHYEVRPESAA